MIKDGIIEFLRDGHNFCSHIYLESEDRSNSDKNVLQVGNG